MTTAEELYDLRPCHLLISLVRRLSFVLSSLCSLLFLFLSLSLPSSPSLALSLSSLSVSVCSHCSPNVVQLFEVIDDTHEDMVFMIFECLTLGCLMDMSDPDTVYCVPEDQARKYFRQLVGQH